MSLPLKVPFNISHYSRAMGRWVFQTMPYDEALKYVVDLMEAQVDFRVSSKR